MAYTVSTISAAETAARAAGYPCFIAGNVLSTNALTAVWKSGAVDATDVSQPPSRAYDWSGKSVTKPSSAGANPVYLEFTLTAAPYFDAVVVLGRGGGTSPSGSVWSLQIADDSGFSTNLRTIATASSTRWVTLSLNDANERYTSVEYARLKITPQGGGFTAIPYVTEILLGRQRQLPHGPEHPYRQAPSRSQYVDFIARTGSRTRYALAYGAADRALRFRWSGPEPNGLDCETQMRAWFSESQFGLTPWFYLEDPRNAYNANWYFLEPAEFQPELVDFAEKEIELECLEQPPYLASDPA